MREAPHLLPAPIGLTRLGGSVPAAAARRPPRTLHDGRLAPGHYRLDCAHDGATITTAPGDDAAAACARRTLDQLLAQFPGDLPALAISDGPAFAHRGFMLDVSRDRVPTMDALGSIIDLLAALKFNHLQLYTEHAFAYAGHEAVWQDAGPITPGEARSLDGLCIERGVSLDANQNCFGHLQKWLTNPRYADLAETHGDWRFLHVIKHGPFSLCPTDPRSFDLVRDLLDQLMPCFSSRLVNIGCDETYDVGQGRSKRAVAERGRAAVYLDFVGRICDHVRAAGRTPMLWADIALHHPEALANFPAGAIALAWGYEPDAEFGQWTRILRGHDIRAWVCPGTSSWRSITGRTTERRQNIARAAIEGAAAKAEGFLLTDWGDTGHHQVWPISLPAIAQAAQAAWNPGSPLDRIAASMFVLNQPDTRLLDWLEALGNADEPLRRAHAVKNSTCLFNEMHHPLGAPTGLGDGDDWNAVLDRLSDLERSRPASGDDLIDAETAHTIRVAKLAASIRLAQIMGATSEPLARDAREVLDEHRRLWPRRSRHGGLDDSCSHYERLIVRLELAT